MNKAVLMLSVLCVTLIGCKVDNRPIDLTAEILTVTESENNKLDQFSGGMYQKFWDVTMVITAPEEHVGKEVLVYVEDRNNFPADPRYKIPGTEIKFSMTPKTLRAGTAKMDQLLKSYFTKRLGE